MDSIFPPPIVQLPAADIPIKGVEGYLSQSDAHQIIFMRFSEDVEVPEHSHESQWGIVLEGTIDLTIGGVRRTYMKGDRYFIDKGVRHSARVSAGYADVTFFNQASRYRAREHR
jgi:quercetin dioxygenase-like cupin family protein